MRVSPEMEAKINKMIASGQAVDHTAARKEPQPEFPSNYTEAMFAGDLLTFARRCGWKCAHFRPAQTRNGRWITAVQGDGKGFLDWELVRSPRIIKAELKVPPNKLTPEQEDWIRAYEGTGVEVYVWVPADWSEIERILR